MKKLLVVCVLVGVVLFGIGYVKENKDGRVKTEINNKVVTLDVRDGLSIDVHEHGFMDDVCESGEKMLDSVKGLFDL